MRPNVSGSVTITFRCESSVAQKLDELCRLSGVKRSQFLISAILSEYDKVQGNPQMRELLERFRDVSELMKDFTGLK